LPNSIPPGELSGPKAGSMPTDDDLFWPEAMREVQAGMMRSAQTAAAWVIAWALVGWTVVVVGLITGAVGRMPPAAISLILWLLPLVWWSLAAIWALRVFSVRRYRYFANSPDSAHKAIMRIGRKKTEHLYWAGGLWAAGVLSLLCAVVYEVLLRT
jgi:hypothetical protein